MAYSPTVAAYTLRNCGIWQVAQVAGGVGRNIAEAAHHLLQSDPQQQLPAPQAVHLISILGRDSAADALLATFKHLG